MIKIDQMTAANEAAITQFNYFAQLSLANMEKLASFGLSVAKANIDQATAHAQSLAAARDVQEVVALNTAAVEPALKRAYSYSRSAYETVAATNDEVKKVFEKQTAEMNHAAVTALEEAFKYAPAGSESVIGNVKSAIAAAQSAFSNAAAINKQIYDSVEATVQQNVETVKSATKAKPAKRK